MQNHPFFSIIVPVFNTEKFLNHCLDSLLAQSFTNFEIIVINDCSPGNCKDIIKTYTDKRIQYVHKEKNEGTHLARKSGVEKANSEYCLFLDCDDYYEINALQVLYDYLQENPVDLVEFGYREVPVHTTNTFLYLETKENFLDRILKKQLAYRDFSLANKPIKTRIAKTAFSKMKDFYCIWFEDGYEQFIIHTHCTSFGCINQYLLILDATSGITRRNYELTYKKFSIQVENVAMVISSLYEYIEKENLQKYKPILKEAFPIHSLILMYHFYPELRKEDKKMGRTLIWKKLSKKTYIVMNVKKIIRKFIPRKKPI